MNTELKANSRKLNFLILGSKVLIVVSILMALIAVYLDLHLYLRTVPQDFDKAMAQQVEAAKYPSASVVVFNKDEIIFSKSYGLANIEENKLATPDTLYQIASVSKLVTTTAILRLVDSGQISLDDDVNLHLPFEVRNPHYPSAPISVRMLLSHVSSVRDGPAYWDSYTIGVSEDPTEPLGLFLQQYFSSEQGNNSPAANFVKAKPGSEFEYSNIGFWVIRISGRACIRCAFL